MKKKKDEKPIQAEIEAIQSSLLSGMTDRQIHTALAALAKNGEQMEVKVMKTPRIRAPGKWKTVLTPQQATEIRAPYIPFIVGKKRLADQYGVSISTVLKIVRNKIFKTEAK